MDVSQVEDMVRAAELYDLTPVARVPTNSYHDILRFLDRGVMGVLVPHISSRADAEAAVYAAKYYPLGERGSFTGGRLSAFGTEGLSQREYYDRANQETMILALIESREGVENIEEIASVPEIDVIGIGPSDLSQALGIPEQNVLEEAIDRVIQAALKAGKAVGVGGTSMANMDRLLGYINKGCRYVNMSSIDLMKYGAGVALDQLRSAV
jgi:4-hydroxy-2-oxoheptanedioate aldolase